MIHYAHLFSAEMVNTFWNVFPCIFEWYPDQALPGASRYLRDRRGRAVTQLTENYNNKASKNNLQDADAPLLSTKKVFAPETNAVSYKITAVFCPLKPHKNLTADLFLCIQRQEWRPLSVSASCSCIKSKTIPGSTEILWSYNKLC